MGNTVAANAKLTVYAPHGEGPAYLHQRSQVSVASAAMPAGVWLQGWLLGLALLGLGSLHQALL